MDQLRVRTQDQNVSVRPVPITHLRVNATTEGGADTLLTVRDRVALKIQQLAVVNTTGTAATLTLHSIPSGGSIGLGNAEIVGVSIPANTTADLTDYIGQFYEAGTVLRAYSGTADALVVHGWAEEIL